MKQLVFFLLAIVLVGSVTAASVVIKTTNPAAGLNDAAYYRYKAGDVKGAEELYLAAIKADSSYQLARYNLATLYFEEQRFVEASKHLQTLTTMDGQNPKYHYDLAVNLIEEIRQHGSGLGNFNRALNEYKAAEKISPGFAHAQENIEVLERIKAHL